MRIRWRAARASRAQAPALHCRPKPRSSQPEQRQHSGTRRNAKESICTGDCRHGTAIGKKGAPRPCRRSGDMITEASRSPRSEFTRAFSTQGGRSPCCRRAARDQRVPDAARPLPSSAPRRIQRRFDGLHRVCDSRTIYMTCRRDSCIARPSVAMHTLAYSLRRLHGRSQMAG